jgi:Dienelactone hydrolase family
MADVYPGTKHALFNDQLPKRYDARAAADSWQRVLAFLRRTRQGSLSQHVARPFSLKWSPWSSNGESPPRGPCVVVGPR